MPFPSLLKFRIFVALAVAPLPAIKPALADTLVDNVDGLTLDQRGQIERFSGLLIGDDGRIVQVLQRGDKRPGRVDYLLDGQGRVLMPGLIDSHVDLMALGFSALTLDVGPAKSLAEVQARVAAYTAAHPDRPWILGRGWDATSWGLGRDVTATDLDVAVSGRPVWLVSADGHHGWANSAALSAAGITALTKSPAGGRIVVAGGKPTGFLVESAMNLVEKAVPPPRPEDQDLALATAQGLLVERGITAVADIGTTIEAWQSYRRAGDSGALRVRVMAYAANTDAMALIGGPGPSPWLYEDRLRLNGVALTFDGTLATRGAWLKTPYADAASSSGLPRMTDTQLRNLMSRAALDRFQVAVEAHGDAAAAAMLDAVSELAQTYKGERRWRLEGIETLSGADAARLGSLGVIASVQPATFQPSLANQRLGTARLADAWRWASVSDGNAVVAFGSDAPTAVISPFAGMARATTRQDAEGLPYGGWQPQERLTRESALAAYTSNGAFAGFAEGRFGRLAIGQRADFLLVDRDPILATASELGATRVLETWIDGRKVWAATGTTGTVDGR